ncbi:hypothetical protein BH09PAT2_BH09PAT2_08940 [soil metagenome]
METQQESNSLKNVLRWLLKGLIVLFQALLFAAFIIGGWFILQTTGILPVQVPVSGASMLPTLPEDGFVDFQRYVADSRVQKVIHQKISRGDIVVFENKKTVEELQKQHKDGTGFVQRVIGVPGDTVTIRDGFVNVNDEAIDEPYILKPRSTFGGDSIGDCRTTTVPEGKLLVLGDNRKISMDSRHLGLISQSDIQYFIPFSKQPERFATKWRDTSHDLDFEHSSLFDVNKYTALLNQQRAKNGLSPLKYQPLLEQSALLRAQVMLKYDDFSFDATKSGYSMADSLRDVGYANTVYGEFPMTGYYDAQELFDAFLEQPDSTQFLLNKDYTEIGVSTFVGQLNGCPVQVVVQHLAGYIPPNYSDSEVTSWRDGLTRLKDVQPGWKKLQEYNDFYTNHKEDVDRINVVISTRISRFEKIVTRMESNQWLTSEETAWMKEDSTLADEQNQLAGKLNDTR